MTQSSQEMKFPENPGRFIVPVTGQFRFMHQRPTLRQIWSRTIERNRKRSRAYVEDFVIEERPKMV